MQTLSCFREISSTILYDQAPRIAPRIAYKLEDQFLKHFFLLHFLFFRIIAPY